MNVEQDFVYHNGGCFLNDSGRKKYLRAFLTRMTEKLITENEEQPRWELLNRQVKLFKQCIYNPEMTYSPYRIR